MQICGFLTETLLIVKEMTFMMQSYTVQEQNLRTIGDYNKLIVMPQTSKYRTVQITEFSFCQRNHSVLIRDTRDPYQNSMSGAPSHDLSRSSLIDSLHEVNNFLNNQDLPLNGQANLKKNQIVMRSKTKELSTLLPRRSQLNVKSVLQRLKPSSRYQLNESLLTDDPAGAYSVHKSQNAPLRLAKIAAKNSVSLDNRGDKSSFDKHNPLLDDEYSETSLNHPLYQSKFFK